MNAPSWKPRHSIGPLWQTVFRGRGLDVSDRTCVLAAEFWPDITDCDHLSIESDDRIHGPGVRTDGGYDFVYGCRFLENVTFPGRTLAQCWSLVKANGHLVIVVPDEDLYEQGKWPSRFDARHKWTFTLHKGQGENRSWSPRSINLIQLVIENLTDYRFVLLHVTDTGYDYSIRGLDQTLSPNNADAYIECVFQKLPPAGPKGALDGTV